MQSVLFLATLLLFAFFAANWAKPFLRGKGAKWKGREFCAFRQTKQNKTTTKIPVCQAKQTVIMKQLTEESDGDKLLLKTVDSR